MISFLGIFKVSNCIVIYNVFSFMCYEHLFSCKIEHTTHMAFIKAHCHTFNCHTINFFPFPLLIDVVRKKVSILSKNKKIFIRAIYQQKIFLGKQLNIFFGPEKEQYIHSLKNRNIKNINIKNGRLFFPGSWGRKEKGRVWDLKKLYKVEWGASGNLWGNAGNT